MMKAGRLSRCISGELSLLTSQESVSRVFLLYFKSGSRNDRPQLLSWDPPPQTPLGLIRVLRKIEYLPVIGRCSLVKKNLSICKSHLWQLWGGVSNSAWASDWLPISQQPRPNWRLHPHSCHTIKKKDKNVSQLTVNEPCSGLGLETFSPVVWNNKETEQILGEWTVTHLSDRKEILHKKSHLMSSCRDSNGWNTKSPDISGVFWRTTTR